MTGQGVRAAAGFCVALAIGAFFLPWVRLSPPPLKHGKAKAPKAQERSAIDGKSGRIRNLGGAVDEVLSGLTTGTRQVARKFSGIPPRISGFRAPIIANSRLSKNVMELVESFSKKKENVGLKSWAVYALPGLAILLAALLARFPDDRRIAVFVAAAGLIVFAGGAARLITLDLTNDFVKVTIDYGLWLSLAAYLGLALTALKEMFDARKKSAPASR